MLVTEIILAGVLSYLFGSISSAIIVCKLWGLPDPRTHGSKNPGATNVLRIAGKKPALITLLGDVLKGVIPIVVVKSLGFSAPVIAVSMFAVFLGHLYPIFFKFEGGKGVATLLGCLFALSLPVGLSWLITWLIIALIFRYSSLASLVASIFAPLDVWVITQNLWFTITVTLMSIILIYRHRSNIQKLIRGEEHKW